MSKHDSTVGHSSGPLNLLSSSGTPGRWRSTVTAWPSTSRTSWYSGVANGSPAWSRWA
ncbi:hypothetical protein O1L55_39700 [Streptomyces albulus]|nr:hypothetical protein [Streptomyces noursei]